MSLDRKMISIHTNLNKQTNKQPPSPQRTPKLQKKQV